LGVEIDMEKLDSIALDTSTFPHCTLEIRHKGESFIQKHRLKTHQKGDEIMSNINIEWTKYLKEKVNET
jgi:hypothetical protein